MAVLPLVQAAKMWLANIQTSLPLRWMRAPLCTSPVRKNLCSNDQKLGHLFRYWYPAALFPNQASGSPRMTISALWIAFHIFKVAHRKWTFSYLISKNFDKSKNCRTWMHYFYRALLWNWPFEFLMLAPFKVNLKYIHLFVYTFSLVNLYTGILKVKKELRELNI